MPEMVAPRALSFLTAGQGERGSGKEIGKSQSKNKKIKLSGWAFVKSSLVDLNMLIRKQTSYS